MLRDIGLVFFVYRALVCFFLVALSFDKPVTQKALLIIPSALYISLSMYVFLFPGKLRLFKNYGDVFFLPLIALLSGQREALFALLPPVAMYTSRDLFRGMLFTWLSVGLALTTTVLRVLPLRRSSWHFFSPLCTLTWWRPCERRGST
ncbi:MAG: hypothetical protein N3C13_03545 [Aquificaceae bacterium]|nr:hypothetical protein [Aquificaceae bacterium]